MGLSPFDQDTVLDTGAPEFFPYGPPHTLALFYSR
jgi:hypothetical protein